MGTVKTLNQSEFAQEVLKSNVPVIVDFYADWCGPCRALAPVLENTQKALGSKANIVKINVDEAGELSRKYKVMSIPTMVIIDGGEEKDRLVGLINESTLIDRINRHLK